MTKNKQSVGKILFMIVASLLLFSSNASAHEQPCHNDGRGFHPEERRKLHRPMPPVVPTPAPTQTTVIIQKIEIKKVVKHEDDHRDERRKETAHRLPATGSGALGVLGAAVAAGLILFGLRKLHKKSA
jgi:hypothetical protein